MKAITVFSLIVLISIIISQDIKNCLAYVPTFYPGTDREGNEQAYSLDFCRSTYFDSSDYYTCCFLKYKNTSDAHRYHCYPVTHAQMANIDPLVDSIKGNVSKLYSLDCSSSYLYGSLLLILALLF